MKGRAIVEGIVGRLVARKPELDPMGAEILAAAELLVETYTSGHKVLVCGNGGSAADADHIVGELMKGFLLKRELPEARKAGLEAADPVLGKELAASLQGSLPAIALSQPTALLTAFANDVDPDMVFAQAVLGYGLPGDLLWGMTTSGNARNVNYAAVAAKAGGLRVLGMTGRSGGSLAPRCDLCLRVPETETFLIQELHLPIYHALCAAVEAALFGRP